MADVNAQSTTTFESLKAEIDRRYPHGRFVAIEGDQIVADADSVRNLVDKLAKMGKRPQQMQAVQAGVDYPKTAVILMAGTG
jgi:hypothetical protein